MKIFIIYFIAFTSTVKHLILAPSEFGDFQKLTCLRSLILTVSQMKDL